MELCSPHGAEVVDDLKRHNELKYVGAAPGTHEVDRSSLQSRRDDFERAVALMPRIYFRFRRHSGRGWADCCFDR